MTENFQNNPDLCVVCKKNQWDIGSPASMVIANNRDYSLSFSLLVSISHMYRPDEMMLPDITRGICNSCLNKLNDIIDHFFFTKNTEKTSKKDGKPFDDSIHF